MRIVYIGGPVDGMEDPSWPGSLPDIMYVPRRRVVPRFVKPEPALAPRPLSAIVHHYRFRDCIDGVASYVFVRE